MMKDETPKRKKTRAKNAEKFNPKDIKNIQDLTQKALTSFLQDQIKGKDDNRKNLEVLSSIIEEFLASFIILGYSLDGLPVQIISAHSQQEADSLTTLVNKFLSNNISNGSDD